MAFGIRNTADAAATLHEIHRVLKPGGIALILGVVTRWAAVLLAIDMAVAVGKVHLHGGFFLPRGYEFALTLLAACVALALAGPGSPALKR